MGSDFLCHRAGYLSLSWLIAIYAIHDHWEKKIHTLKINGDSFLLSQGQDHARRKEVEFPRS